MTDRTITFHYTDDGVRKECAEDGVDLTGSELSATLAGMLIDVVPENRQTAIELAMLMVQMEEAGNV